MTRRSLALAAMALLAPGALAGVGIAKPVTSAAGGVEVEVGGAFAPKAVLWERIRRVGGGHPPALQELRVRGDKALALDLRGLPICKLGGRDVRRSVAEVRKVCGRAVVGSGWIEAEIEFAGDPPVSVGSELLLVKIGGHELWLFAYLPAPVTGAFTAPVQSGRALTAKLPPVAGGRGSITRFSLGLRKGVLAASCREGHVKARVTSTFEGGVRTAATLTRPCATQRVES